MKRLKISILSTGFLIDKCCLLKYGIYWWQTMKQLFLLFDKLSNLPYCLFIWRQTSIGEATSSRNVLTSDVNWKWNVWMIDTILVKIEIDLCQCLIHNSRNNLSRESNFCQKVNGKYVSRLVKSYSIIREENRINFPKRDQKQSETFQL